MIDGKLKSLPKKARFNTNKYNSLRQDPNSKSPRIGWARPGARLEASNSGVKQWMKVKLPSGDTAYLKGTIVNTTVSGAATNVAIGSNTTANMGSVDMKNSSYSGTIVNTVTGMTATNVAIGSGSEANSGSVVMKNRSAGGGAGNVSSSGVVINDIKIPLSGLSGQNANVAVGGKTSNKNSVVFK